MVDAWEYIKVNVGFDFGRMDAEGDIIMPGAFGSKRKIRIAPNQPINTSMFEDAIVLEYNGVPTAAGMRDRLDNHPYFIKEGEMKPIIDFINRL